ncbi:hypothetical protein G6O69_34275 [Pseudenhygromyxa sp. WMMC2535]|uniref:hypothetical protein n=1 Tax=Pseudenhygromyxa sp. WMMC2535 TaxID=2712867 RepID=UPI001556B4D7|nr:hypothetical protein [Pseudenhygromyxa sp. WMMC2535]NVB42939.1 hypothetical protein [Pseudenhygromyxa sp. WMMC2535]
MLSTSSTRDEVIEFYGYFPLLFQTMERVGELEEAWPPIRALHLEHEPLPRPVVDAIFATMGLRCGSDFCFVFHSLALIGAGAKKVEIDDLGRFLQLPDVVPDRERWDRIVRLNWLAEAPGRHQRAAAFALEQACSPAEYAKVRLTCTVSGLLSKYTELGNIDANAVLGEPPVLAMPPEFRALIPDFVQFHSELHRVLDPSAAAIPVASMCSSCKAVRTKDGEWYPGDVASELLPADVMFSHGLCERCVEELGLEDYID